MFENTVEQVSLDRLQSDKAVNQKGFRKRNIKMFIIRLAVMSVVCPFPLSSCSFLHICICLSESEGQIFHRAPTSPEMDDTRHHIRVPSHTHTLNRIYPLEGSSKTCNQA